MIDDDIKLGRTTGLGSELYCPCGMNNLHQYKYKIFERSEDQQQVKETTVDGQGTYVRMVANKDSDNPSSRRNGMQIFFACEGEHEMVLTISQHKGCTYIRWD